MLYSTIRGGGIIFLNVSAWMYFLCSFSGMKCEHVLENSQNVGIYLYVQYLQESHSSTAGPSWDSECKVEANFQFWISIKKPNKLRLCVNS